MKERKKFPIGESDFASLRQGGYAYVDKSLLIEEVMTDAAKVLLIPRPRRFGKTLNLSMLRYFFEKPLEEGARIQVERRALFLDLQIESSQTAWAHFQKYPVMFLTFKDVKAHTWEDTFATIAQALAKLYKEHDYLQEGTFLSAEEKELYQTILSRKPKVSDCFDALSNLSRYLATYHGEKVVILVDEYDTPIHSAYTNGFYDEAISFFRNLLSSVLKDNPYLYKGVLTGILRVAKESIFSGLNHLAVYSFLKPQFSTCFGFTEEEVLHLAQESGHEGLMTDIKSWYNGYLFGKKHEIYNPWSILNFLASPEPELQPYWVNTSSNDLIQKLLFESGINTQEEVELLLRGGEIEKPLEESLSLRDLDARSLWSFLLFTGYLKVVHQFQKEDTFYATMKIPNREVKIAFSSLTQSWFQKLLGRSQTVDSFIKAVFAGDAEKLEDTLSHLLKVSLSFHDVKEGKGSKESKEEEKTDPEAVYHSFVLGMLVHLSSDYEVRSNRESGYGLADVMLLPKQAGKPGVVFEFKAVKRGKSTEKVLEEAWNQIQTRNYRTELEEQGANPIYEYAIAFSGKQAFVKHE